MGSAWIVANGEASPEPDQEAPAGGPNLLMAGYTPGIRKIDSRFVLVDNSERVVRSTDSVVLRTGPPVHAFGWNSIGIKSFVSATSTQQLRSLRLIFHLCYAQSSVASLILSIHTSPVLQQQRHDILPVKIRRSMQGRIASAILVCNAGIAGPNHTTWEYPIADWKRVIEINLLGVFFCCRAIVPHMLGHGYGRIVNVASIAGKEGNPNASAYSASKAGVIALTKSLGKETANRNIAVNCITPAAARTRIFDQMTQQHIDFMLSRIPRNRFLEVDEVSAMVAWLVSEENSFTTGAVFDLSGGRATY